VLSADRFGCDVDDLTGCGLSTFRRDTPLAGKARDTLNLDSPGSIRRVDGVCGECDDRLVERSVAEPVPAETNREFPAVEVVLDRQDHGQHVDRQSDSTERCGAEKFPTRRGWDRVLVEMLHVSLIPRSRRERV
jgi:hypothetical protein